MGIGIMCGIQLDMESIGLENQRPFDVGFQAGLSHQELFDCPYGHAAAAELRRRHEWLEGYLTALAQAGISGPF